MVDAIIKGEADAVLAASILHFKECRINDIKRAMQQSGIPVRIE
jgi:cyclase